MAVSVSIIAHNHNHIPIWKYRFLNQLTDYWITLFYGFPAFVWIPTHNLNHHPQKNGAADYSRTYRLSEANNLLTLLSYPMISGYFQQIAIGRFLKNIWKTNRKRCWLYLSQAILLVSYLTVALFINYKKALLFIIIPQQVALFSVLILNYLQHVHADEESEWNHSRNMVGSALNILLFNNGFHTIHHHRPGLHWSKTPEAHRKIANLIDPCLNEKSFWWLIIRVYLLGIIISGFRTQSMRLERLRNM
jgi:fatty acid desaturase